MFKTVGRVLASRVTHFVACAVICFVGPLVMVTGHFQQALRSFSHIQGTVFGFSIPLLPVLEGLALLTALPFLVAQATKQRILVVGILAAMFLYSWLITDVYIHLSLYDIQANYHYGAYVVVVLMFLRAFARRDVPKHKIVYRAFFTCYLVSLADEGFQRFVSYRVFDLNDTAKDALGTVMGLIVAYFLLGWYGRISLRDLPRQRQNLRAYVQNPACAIVFVTALTVILLTLSSLFSSPSYWYIIVFGTAGLFAIALLLFHITRSPKGRRAVYAAVGVAAVAQLICLGIWWNDGIVYHSSWLTVCRGVPIPVCDVLIYPNGWPRPADKVHIGRGELHQCLVKYDPSIVLVGAYSRTPGTLSEQPGARLEYSAERGRIVQVAASSPDEACDLYNRYTSEGKRVICVLRAACGGAFP